MAQPDRQDSTVIPSASHPASQTRALWILATLAMLASLRIASGLLIPIVIAVLASLALEPLVAGLVRRSVPRLAWLPHSSLGCCSAGSDGAPTRSRTTSRAGCRRSRLPSNASRELLEQMLGTTRVKPDQLAAGPANHQPTRRRGPPLVRLIQRRRAPASCRHR